MGRIYDQCEHCGEMYDEHGTTEGNWPCQCEGSKQARIDCEKAALRKRLADMAAGAGFEIVQIGTGASRYIDRFWAAMDKAFGLHEVWGLNESFLHGLTLDELTDKLWKLGVRA